MALLLRFDGGDNYVEFDSPLNINNSTVYIKFKSGIQDRRRFILGTVNSAFYIRINNGLLEYGVFGRSGNLPTQVQENTEYTLRISHGGVAFDISEPLLGSASDTGTNETEFRFIGRWFTGSDRFNGDIFYIKKYDFTEENLLANYEKQALSGPNDTVLPDTVGGNNGTLVNFPTDNSQWVFYDDGSSPEPVAQPVSLITAEIKNEALTLPISEALSVNLLTGEHVTNGYVLNLVSSQVGNATTSEERHQASMLTVEQTASQSVISIAAEHLSEAQILTPIQYQRLNSIVAQQVEQALSASFSSIQALTFVVAEERQNAAPLTVEQYTGQLITLIAAEQREGAQTLLVSQVNKLDLVTAEQASDAQALSIKDLQKIKTIEVEQLTEAEILHVLLSGDNTDLTGLRLQPVTPIYSITPIANSYSLNKV